MKRHSLLFFLCVCVCICRAINFDDDFLLPFHPTDAFDVYNIETALPVIDLEAIESHLMASAKEEAKKVGDTL
jgi:hypothetical protein